MQVAERRRHLGSALLGLEAGAYQQAETACTPLFQGDGVDVEALLLLGYAVAARGDHARAAAILDRVARERPDQPHPCADLLRALPKVPRPRVAAQFQASLRLAPEDTRLRAAYADFLLDGGQPEQRSPWWRNGCSSSPTRPWRTTRWGSRTVNAVNSGRRWSISARPLRSPRRRPRPGPILGWC